MIKLSFYDHEQLKSKFYLLTSEEKLSDTIAFWREGMKVWRAGVGM
ncbi:hypothetical protein SAMN05421640_2523 [Ekhidna lutea]|uniref:Uncharacterized protein n=1 Tax=Ekhidna lutea TaxID=447679 RepID=A0A239K981_EKHLU|nr:hypothetical protein SAMN05421640_2523 [Ekhidna lutea]